MLSKIPVVRKAIESLYDSVAVIITRPDETVDKITGIVGVGEQVSASYPCRVSYKTVKPADAGEGLASFGQIITLFINPEVLVLAGSDVDVEHRGRRLRFAASGVPAVYTNHQEVPLKHREKYNG